MKNGQLGPYPTEVSPRPSPPAVDYGRLIGVDEVATLTGLKLRRSNFDRLVADCGGHELGTAGDSLMADLPSAVNALRCAQAIQPRVSSENASLPPASRMQLRISVNLGDGQRSGEITNHELSCRAV